MSFPYKFTLLLCSAALAFVPALLGAQSQFRAEPNRIERGKSAAVTISDPACSLKDVTIESPASGISTSTVGESGDGCKVFIQVLTGSGAAFGSFNLLITRKPAVSGSPVLVQSIPIEVTATLPEPIPPGLTPGVDVTWSILPYRETADAFGRKVASQYFAVNIKIGNNSAFPIQLAGFGFDLNNLLRSANGQSLPPSPSPNTPYHVTRSTIERDREVGGRAIILNSLTAALSVYSVAGGFFGTGQGGLANAANAAAKDRYALFLALGNPVAAGFGLLVPDKTIRHLIAIDTRAFRDNQIIANNTHQHVLTFISRDLAECPSREPCKPLTDPPGWKGTITRLPYNRRSFDPNAVKATLGNLVIVGQEIQYLNRVRVINRPDPTVAAPPVVQTPKIIELRQGANKQEISITGNSLVGATAKVISRPDVKPALAEINSDGTAAKLIFDVDDDATPGDLLLQIERPNDPAWTLPVRILPAAPKVVPPPAPKEIEQTKTEKIKITGRFLVGARCRTPDLSKVACELSRSEDDEASSAGKEAILTVTPQYGAPLGKVALTIVRNGQLGDKTVEIEVIGGTPVFTPVPSKLSIKTTPTSETITLKLKVGDFLTTSMLAAEGLLQPLAKITTIGSVTGDRGAEVAEFRIEFSAKPAVGTYSISVKNGGKSTAIPLQVVQ
jgi:hypothetical protein